MAIKDGHETALMYGDSSITGDPEVISSTAGAAHVTTAPGGVARIRQEAALDGTAKTMDFGSPGVSAVKLSIVSEAAGTAELPATVAFCIDPLSDAVRDAWLTPGDSLAVDSQMLIALVDKENDVIVFTSPVRYLGIKRLFGSQALTAVAVGVEV